MEQNICTHCGFRLPPRVRFCTNCGWQVKVGPQETSELRVTPPVEDTVRPEGVDRLRSYLQRGELALEEGEWEEADRLFEEALVLAPQSADAYLGKLMAELRVPARKELKNCAQPFDSNKYYGRAMRFGDEAVQKLLTDATNHIYSRIRAFQLQKAKPEPVVPTPVVPTPIPAAPRKKSGKKWIILAACLCACIALVVSLVLWGIPATKYRNAEKLLSDGKNAEAAMAFGALGNYSDARKRSLNLWEKSAQRCTISAGAEHTIALKEDGTVIVAHDRSPEFYDCSNWSNIVAVDAGQYYIVGLKSDGTVVATGRNDDEQCEVSEWSDIVAISAGRYHTLGLKKDGTVVSVGGWFHDERDVYDWKDIVDIEASSWESYGLRSDGTVVCAGEGYFTVHDEVAEWTDIIAISAGWAHVIGLRSDGTVVSAHSNEGDYDYDYGQCDVSHWNDIVAIAGGGNHTVGLRSDGTVVATGDNEYGQCEVSGWTDIVAICAGESHTVGLKADGTVVTVGNNLNGRCDVSEWTDIMLPKSSSR